MSGDGHKILKAFLQDKLKSKREQGKGKVQRSLTHPTCENKQLHCLRIIL
jgi:hypothetical protein